MSNKTIAEQVKDAMDEAEKPIEDNLKIGEFEYARSGMLETEYVIVGAPRVRGVRWVTIAPKVGGLTSSMPESVFLLNYWNPLVGR